MQKTHTRLKQLRDEIDIIDDTILNELTKRIEIVKSIGAYKIEKGLPLYDEERKNALIQNKKEKAVKKGLSPELIEKMYTLFHDYSLSLEEKL